jgi:hypothetical protein
MGGDGEDVLGHGLVPEPWILEMAKADLKETTHAAYLLALHFVASIAPLQS